MRVITGSVKGRRLEAPDGLDTRPTGDRIKEAIFDIIQFEIEGRRVLDLFAGSGQLGIEALSRGAKEAVFVDKRAEAVAVIRRNLAHCKLDEASRVIAGDYRTALRSGVKFDIVFLDPPYASGLLEEALGLISSFDIINDGGIIVCEIPSEKDLPELPAPYVKSKTYRYGKTSLIIYRKEMA